MSQNAQNLPVLDEKRENNPGGNIQNQSDVTPKVIREKITQFAADIDRERKMHLLATGYFSYVDTWILTKPSTFLTLIIGVLNLLSGSPFVTKETSERLVLYSGILALIVTFWKQMADTFQFGSRARLHSSVAITLKRLIEDLSYNTVNLPKDEEELQSLLLNVREKFHQALDGCTSTIPTVISSSFMAMRDDVDAQVNSEIMFNDKTKSPFNMTSVYMIADQSLFQAFCNFKKLSYVASPGIMAKVGFETLKLCLGKKPTTWSEFLFPASVEKKERDDLVYLLRRRRAQNAADADRELDDDPAFNLELFSENSLWTSKQIDIVAPGATREDVTIRTDNNHITVTVKPGNRRSKIERVYKVNYPTDPENNILQVAISNGVLSINPPPILFEAIDNIIRWESD